MRIVFHGLLREKFGVDFHMEADTAAEALEGFSRQADWPKHLVVRVVSGNELLDQPEQLNEWHREIHLIPTMRGGGGKFGQIIMGAIIIGIGFIPGIGQAVAISLWISGGLMILQGVVGLFLKAPKMDKNSDPEASKYISVSKNTTLSGTPITMAWGTIDMAGQWLSLNSDSTNMTYGTFPVTP